MRLLYKKRNNLKTQKFRIWILSISFLVNLPQSPNFNLQINLRVEKLKVHINTTTKYSNKSSFNGSKAEDFFTLFDQFLHPRRTIFSSFSSNNFSINLSILFNQFLHEGSFAISIKFYTLLLFLIFIISYDSFEVG
jgi:hypothetical protein